MFIDIIPNRKSRPTILLRDSTRIGSKVVKRTLANITSWPPERIENLRRVLKDEKLIRFDDAFSIEASLPHGHVQAVLGTLRKLGLDNLIASKRCRERDLVIALIVERLLHPGSKLATTRTWNFSTLAKEIDIEDASPDEVYSALEWLGNRQKRIENKLSRRHLVEGGLALYDLSSSSYYGSCCPLARKGKNRDGKKLPCIAYGLLTDSEGRPVLIEVFPGNTADPSTVRNQAVSLKERFGLERAILVGDRGMITNTQIKDLQKFPGLGWISALRTADIRKLVAKDCLQMSLFDEVSLAEISSPDFPDERLIACFNPLMAAKRRNKRNSLLDATEESLNRIRREVLRRTKKPLTDDEIGLKVGKVINRYKVAKHFNVIINDGELSWRRREDRISKEASLDGIYVVRTSESSESFDAPDAVRNYKRLSLVERVFRTLKSFDILIRPIFLRKDERVRAHFFLCMLAYYVEWHMRKALAPFLFDDEEVDDARSTRDPVAKAEPSESAMKKRITKKAEDGTPLQSFPTLIESLTTIVRSTVRMKSDPAGQTFLRDTEPSHFQKRVFELLETCPVAGN